MITPDLERLRESEEGGTEVEIGHHSDVARSVGSPSTPTR